MLPDDHLPRYYTARSGAAIARTNAQILREKITPDAWMTSERGDKKFKLFTRATLEAYANRRRGGESK